VQAKRQELVVTWPTKQQQQQQQMQHKRKRGPWSLWTRIEAPSQCQSQYSCVHTCHAWGRRLLCPLPLSLPALQSPVGQPAPCPCVWMKTPQRIGSPSCFCAAPVLRTEPDGLPAPHTPRRWGAHQLRMAGGHGNQARDSTHRCVAE
jgi:hypothetical protein